MSGTDILYLNIPGRDMVVLSTSEAVSDLLDQRSAIYSDKVRSRGPNMSASNPHPFLTSRIPPWPSCESIREVAFYRSS